MNIKKIMFLLGLSLGLITLMSSQCETEEPIPDCNGVVTATATGHFEQTFCFDKLSSYDYNPATSISLWARESTTDIGFDMSISADKNKSITPGTYNCGNGEPGFVEIIIEDQTIDNHDFYKSKSGTITITQATETSFNATFNVVAVGYYNGETINLSGTVNK